MAYTVRYNPAYAGNYQKGRSKKIDKIVLHHAATTDFDGIGRTFQKVGRKASAHYGVGRNNNVDQYVYESDTAWHAGTLNPFKNPNPSSIGIEHVNASGSPDWAIDEKTFNTSVELARDIAERHGLLPLVVGKNLFQHKDFSATYCAGRIGERLQEYADKVNAMNNGGQAGVIRRKTTPATEQSGNLYRTKFIKNSPVIGRIAAFMYKTFPSYTKKAALGNYFGPNLTKAVKEFQRRTGLEADGNVGPITMAKLKSYGFKG